MKGDRPPPADTPERRLLGGAVGFLRSAELLYAQHPEAWQPCFVDLAFAMELSLKAFLRSRGLSNPDLKRLGHRLTDLCERAEKPGFVPSHVGIRGYVDALHETHANMTVRYLEGDGPQLPPLPATVAATNLLIVDVWEQGLRGERPQP